MIYALIIAPVVALLLGLGGGYFIGRYQSRILDKIRTLEGQAREAPPEPEKPSVTMGSYSPPQEISTSVDKRAAGLVETKTPERLTWENEIAVEKEVLGRG